MLKRFILAAAFVLTFAASLFATEKFSDATPLLPQYWPSHQIMYGATTPTVCNPLTGDVFMVSSGATAGFYRCTAVNTWTRVISLGDATLNFSPATDEAIVYNISVTGWPIIFRHATATSFSLSFQNSATGSLFGDGTRLNLDATGNFLIVNEEAQNVVIANGGAITWTFQATGELRSEGVVFASLPAAPSNGAMIYCSDCTVANPCAAAGTGAIAKRLNGVWVCN